MSTAARAAGSYSASSDGDVSLANRQISIGASGPVVVTESAFSYQQSIDSQHSHSSSVDFSSMADSMATSSASAEATYSAMNDNIMANADDGSILGSADISHLPDMSSAGIVSHATLPVQPPQQQSLVAQQRQQLQQRLMQQQLEQQQRQQQLQSQSHLLLQAQPTSGQQPLSVQPGAQNAQATNEAVFLRCFRSTHPEHLARALWKASDVGCVRLLGFLLQQGGVKIPETAMDASLQISTDPECSDLPRGR